MSRYIYIKRYKVLVKVGCLWISLLTQIKSLFGIVVAVAFQIVFRLEMHQNNILLLFFKNYF
jgi:hypothetical protein